MSSPSTNEFWPHLTRKLAVFSDFVQTNYSPIWIVVSTIVMFVLSGSFLRRSIWVALDSIATIVAGSVLVVAPEMLLGTLFAGGKLDVAHLYLARHVGALLIGSGLTMMLARKSNDSRMFGGLFYARLFSGFLLAAAVAHTVFSNISSSRKGIRFDESALYFLVFGIACSLLGALLQLVRFKQIGGYPRHSNSLTCGLMFDHFVLLFVGILAFAFPTQCLRVVIKKDKTTLNAMHAVLFRSVASLLVGHALSSNAAAGFFYVDDKKSHLIGRMTSQLLAVIINIKYHFSDDIFTIYNVTPFIVVAFYFSFLLMLWFRRNESRGRGEIDAAYHDDQIDYENLPPVVADERAGFEDEDMEYDEDDGGEEYDDEDEDAGERSEEGEQNESSKKTK